MSRHSLCCLPLPVDPRDVCLYRNHTIALLHRYFSMALDVGRLPSLLGREFFRTNVTSYRVRTFEDSVIFVLDMERCLDELDPLAKELLARIVLEGRTQTETAHLFTVCRNTIVKEYPLALDRLSAMLLRVGMLSPFPDPPTCSTNLAKPENCQDPSPVENQATTLKTEEL